MGFCSGITRTIMFIFNFACLAVGAVLIGVGAAAYVWVDEYDKLLEESQGFKAVPSIIIAVGVFIFFISFLGCCGALKNSSCMLTTYAVLLIVLLIVQFIGGVYGFAAYKEDDKNFKKDVVTQIRKSFAKYTEQESIRGIFHTAQTSLKCCGVDSPSDYTLVLQWTPGTYPGGCCGKSTKDICNTSDEVYRDGCGPEIYKSFIASIYLVSAFALAICIVELLGAVVAICLVRSK